MNPHGKHTKICSGVFQGKTGFESNANIVSNKCSICFNPRVTPPFPLSPVYIWRSYLPLTSFPEIAFWCFVVVFLGFFVEVKLLVKKTWCSQRIFKWAGMSGRKKKTAFQRMMTFPSKHKKLLRSNPYE